MRLSFISGVALLQLGIAVTNAATSHQQSNTKGFPSCDSPIYCEGPLLRAVQLAELFPDSKTFPTSKPVDKVLSIFDSIGGSNATKDELRVFVNENFLSAGSDLNKLNMTIPKPLPWVNEIQDDEYKNWIEYLHQAWGDLIFEFNTAGLCDGCVSSTLPAKLPFVVPGGRFREFYYWDSFFVIKGLLLSNQNELAKGMIENFLDFIQEYGFIPNGARIYYLNRSQPPFLVEMVRAYYETTGDDSFVKKALPTLDKEYTFWIGNTTVSIADSVSGKRYQLNRYNVENTSPRPESYAEDYKTAYDGTNFTTTQVIDLFSDLAAGAESGWDYSSRWSKNRIPEVGDKNGYAILRTLNTRNIVPVDLNALLWSMESNLAEWHTKYGGRSSRSAKRANYYKKQANKRLDAMEKILWNDEEHMFCDYNLTSKTQAIEFSPASMYPFWLNAIPERVKSPKHLTHVFDQVRDALSKYPGILTTSLFNTTMQWDWPNGWPPLQYITMQAMLNVDNLLNKQNHKDDTILPMMYTLAERNVATAFCSWYKTGGKIPGLLSKYPGATDDGHMFEKFDVTNIGGAGSGGEYTVQIGFGWTNGVTMWLFELFPNMTAPDCESSVTYNLS
ncbi:glycoside hydrolase family 37 protein [Phycomyces blakesleeanus NRRL 1555(-)]|uniref:Trehalase n=1 Tax=Phycomyces blakesleeanus (strain ATCC 8743b / DSM 1359 / FGSC 10004 / NBRC 33097 / NRRL 1555) TaxID=763407 RepID=A0A163CT31_PHYB8|nr:glycoside hydrolase family 37 protein [Phycomyces blakesleeanus NRRL 1555(-)]OAD65410.1 glycoside hydrolase family 37 protein [Phycomyces blakesleeanus NRRL 1555(-)]|eukprot:XP_018283450.1 glycoside hydrolase family 37 protein [Phycomyces blakesleeanus NRRL 1555(-)]